MKRLIQPTGLYIAIYFDEKKSKKKGRGESLAILVLMSENVF
jgi:hypothetical protein